MNLKRLLHQVAAEDCKKMKKSAFTMAEVILVMLILGIIAAIMITTNKEKLPTYTGFLINAKKVVSEIDSATSNILTKHTYSGDFNVLIDLDNPYEQFDTKDSSSSSKLAALYKKYMASTRRKCESIDADKCTCAGDNSRDGVPSNASSFYLKDGTCIAIAAGSQTFNSIIPGEKAPINVNTKNGMIFIDVNGANEPNSIGRDQFLIPLGDYGVDYDVLSTTSTSP